MFCIFVRILQMLPTFDRHWFREIEAVIKVSASVTLPMIIWMWLILSHKLNILEESEVTMRSWWTSLAVRLWPISLWRASLWLHCWRLFRTSRLALLLSKKWSRNKRQHSSKLEIPKGEHFNKTHKYNLHYLVLRCYLQTYWWKYCYRK